MGRQPDPFDRRPPQQGDRRRAALLEALDAFLREGSFETATIADISARAGVTRSAFYFYFENKAACVAALGARMYEAAIAAADRLLDESAPPQQRIQDMIDTLVQVWESHEYLYRAVLEASRSSGALREMWDGYRESFVEPVRSMIDDERAAGRAPAGPDAATLATLLVDLSDRTLERLDPNDPAGVRRRAETLTTVWVRSIYGEPASAVGRRRRPGSG
jgi:AcrR family transcriptional regulator